MNGETIAGIVADLRRHGIVAADYLADRIEAAWKREARAIATEHAVLPAVCITKPSGNAAAMREALVKIRDKCVIYNNDLAEEIDALCGNALSAPARNCDKYATADEALKAQQAAFEESNFENGECKLGCPGCDDFSIKCEVRWLFAPAKEGGAE